MESDMQLNDEPIFAAEFQQNLDKAPHQSDLGDRIRQLLDQQSFCILSTQGQGQPYGSLIAFAFTEDLKYISISQRSQPRANLDC